MDKETHLDTALSSYSVAFKPMLSSKTYAHASPEDLSDAAFAGVEAAPRDICQSSIRRQDYAQ